MDLVEIKEKLEEALDEENWDIVLEVIGDIDLEENYTSYWMDLIRYPIVHLQMQMKMS